MTAENRFDAPVPSFWKLVRRHVVVPGLQGFAVGAVVAWLVLVLVSVFSTSRARGQELTGDTKGKPATGVTLTPPTSAIPCPNDEPCKVVVITRTEEEILIAERGIFATAAQARNLDLGQYVSYFRQKLAVAPAGTNAPKPVAPAPAPEKK